MDKNVARRLATVPWCCFLGCGKPASFEIEYESGAVHAPENNTHTCETHLAWMIEGDHGQRVTALKVEDQEAWNTASHAALRGVDWRAMAGR